MATRRIDTTIALDGEQAFKQGLASAAREMRVLESESRALAAGFGSSGDAAAQAAAKQKNLQNQVAQQEQIVSALEKAVKDAAAAYGDSSAEVDGYAVKLNNARTRLANLKKALSNADREVEELGRDSQKAGTQISQGIGEGAKKAENDVRSLMETMQDSLDSIKSNTAVMAVKTIWDAALGAYNAVAGFVDGTVDYRRQLSFLQVNAENNGFDFTDIKDKLTEVTGLTGDASASIEGLSNLLAVPGMDSDTLTRAIGGLSGAVISFPDTMKFESLAEGLRETIATGEASGQFVNLLTAMGVSTEDFNKAMAESKTEAGDLEIALAYLAAGGMNDVNEKWRATNAELINNAEKTQELEDAYAGLAQELEPITTGIKGLWTEVVKGATDAIVETKKALNDWAAEEGWTTDTTGATGAVDPWLWGTQTDYTESPYEIVNGKLVEKHAAQESGAEAGAAYTQGFAESFDAGDRDAFAEANKAWMDYNDVASEAGEEAGSAYAESFGAEMQEAGETGGEMLKDGFDSGVESGESSARNAGEAFGAAYAQGILSKVGYATSAAASLAAAAASAAAAKASAAAQAAPGTFSAVVNIDGRQAGTLLAPYVSEIMAVTAD